MKIKIGRFSSKELSAEEAKKWLIDSLLSRAEQLGYDVEEVKYKIEHNVTEDWLEFWARRCITNKSIDLGCIEKVLYKLV